MAHQIAPSVNCSLDEIDLNALKVNILFIYTISVKKDFWFGSMKFGNCFASGVFSHNYNENRRGVVKYAITFIGSFLHVAFTWRGENL